MSSVFNSPKNVPSHVQMYQYLQVLQVGMQVRQVFIWYGSRAEKDLDPESQSALFNRKTCEIFLDFFIIFKYIKLCMKKKKKKRYLEKCWTMFKWHFLKLKCYLTSFSRIRILQRQWIRIQTGPDPRHSM